MNKLLVASLVVGSLILVGCGDDDEPEATSNAAKLTVVERCEGVVMCRVGSEPAEPSVMTKQGDVCYAGRIALESNGVASAPGVSSVTWTASVAALNICASDGCITCTPVSPPSSSTSSAAKAGRCTGSASSCYGRMAGSCGLQEGCSFDQHVRVRASGGTYLESECDGTALHCDAFETEDGCADQEGCSWSN